MSDIIDQRRVIFYGFEYPESPKDYPQNFLYNYRHCLAGGVPWNSPVYSAYDEQYNFYWASWKENVHSQNIRLNDRVFLVIYDSTVPAGTGEGVYVQAKAYELSDRTEIAHAIQQLYGRENRKTRHVDEFLGEYPRRVYKAVPEKMWVNGDGEINGNYIDTRIPLDPVELRKKVK